MSLRVELGLPSAATAIWGEEGEIHIGDVFGGVWCADVFDEETGEYAPAVQNAGPGEWPESKDGLCKFCMQAVVLEQG